LDPSPHGVFLVVIFKYLVGSRTGPFTFSFFSLAPLIKSAHTVNGGKQHKENNNTLLISSVNEHHINNLANGQREN